MSDIVVNQYGDHSVYIGEVNGNVFMNVPGVSPDYRQIFHDISTDLRKWRSVLYQQRHIPRPQTDSLMGWIDADGGKDKERVALLVGAPGSGKSVVMHDVLELLEKRSDVYVLGLKSDQIGFESMESLVSQSGISNRMEDVVGKLAGESKIKRVVLLVDQIDALSLTLSSNRKPLRSILRFIENIQSLEKVRIVVSCRPYDLEYDPYLEQFQYGNRVQMDLLSPNVVEEVLRVNNRKVFPQNTNLFNTLGTPLYLYLFLKLKDDSVDITLTEHGLYGKLWEQTINGESASSSDRVEYQRLLQLLDLITGRMYDSQSLMIYRPSIDSSYSHELDYLLHEEVLIEVSEKRLQFFHQSLFDYVYARRFVEREDDLLSTIRDRHQGLFIRALVKSVLTFMREGAFPAYLSAVRSLLFETDTSGKDMYRFHLKTLVLSMMGYSQNLKPAEISFVRDELSNNRQYAELFAKGIRTGEWFIEIQKIIDHSQGWKAMSENDCLLMLSISSRLIYTEPYLVLTYLIKNIHADLGPSVRNGVINILNSFKPDKNNLAVTEKAYDILIQEERDEALYNLLKNLSDMDPDFALSRLRRIVSSVIDASSRDKYRGRDIQVSHEICHVYEDVLKFFPDKVYDEFLSIVEEVCEKTKSQVESPLLQCAAYCMFQPIVNPRLGYKFAEDILSIVIQETDNRAKEDRGGVVELVSNLNQSKFDTIRLIAASAFVANPPLFKEQILGVFTDSWVLSNCSGMLKYYYRKLLGSAFLMYSHDEQQRILDAIMQSKHLLEKNYAIKEHQQWGIGISLIDELKFEYLSDIPDDILRKDFNGIYKKKLEYMRRFGKRENKKPYHITTHVGWTGLDLGPEGAKKMTSKQWLKAMRKYTTNASLSFDTPTVIGNAHQFEEAVAAEPDKLLETIRTAMADSSIPSAYPYAGLKGLVSAKYDFSVIEELYLKMIAQLNPDVNENSPSDLIELIRQSEYFVENGKKLKKEVVDFLASVVCHYNDKREDKEEDETESAPYQSGINEVRGSACEYLLECYRFPEYTEEIFGAFESLPGNSTIHTRSALLFKMALLNYLDPNRSLDLYLKLMSDYRPNLLALPLHNLNPLLYYINYGFPRLVPLFEKAIETPFCHEEMAPLLWIAAAKKKEGAESLLTRMLDASNKAKEALVLYFVRNKNQKISQDLIIPWVRKCLLSQQQETELAKTYDLIFDDLIKEWSQAVQDEMMGYFIDGGWIVNGNRDYVKHIGSMAISEPSLCLQWLKKSLDAAPNLMQDFYTSSKVLEILIQAYNGLSDFGDKSPDLEFAMDLLDSILRNQEQTHRLDMFLFTLDNA